LEVVGDFRRLDLRAFVNRGFQDDVAGDGKGGWTDEGFDRDLHLFPQNISGLDLANLPMPAPSHWAAAAQRPLELTAAGHGQREDCFALCPRSPRLVQPAFS